MSRRRPHRQVREDNGSGRKRRLHNHTRNGCGSMRVARLVGNAVSAAEANGPCCDLTNARAGSDKVGHTCLLRCPFFQASGSPVLPFASAQWGLLLGPTLEVYRENSCTRERPTQHLPTTLDSASLRQNMVNVSLFDHVNAISPTGPMCCHARPHRGHQTQTSQRERQL